MADKIRLTKSAELESLEKFRAFIDQACERRRIPSATCYELKLAVDEACTNVITHGYANMNPGSIILDMEFDARQITLRLTDFGHPFEPCEPPAPDLNAALQDLPTSGFGLFIIYNVMDTVEYKITGAGNVLSLTKRLTPQTESA